MTSVINTIYITAITIQVFSTGFSLPLVKAYSHSSYNKLPPPPSRNLIFGKNLEDYLTKFGYLPQSNLETGALRTEQTLIDAVKNLQFFAGINVTGNVDQDTMELMMKPRCGVPDVTHTGFRNKRSPKHNTIRVKRYSLQGERWSRTNLTWNLRHANKDSGNEENKRFENLDRGSVRRVLSHALDVWARRTALNFTEVHPNDKTADLQVYFFHGYHDDGYPFDGKGSILAHAFFPGGGRGGDVHFDGDEVWILDETNVQSNDYYKDVNGVYRVTNNLFTVAVHEFGHSLGLAHSAIKGAIMYPWYSYKITYQDPLPDDDLNAIQHLYGKSTATYKANDFDTPSKNHPQEIPITPSATIPTPIRPSTDDIPTEEEVLNRCTAKRFDAIAIIRGEMWIFIGKYFWRIGENTPKHSIPEQPVELKSFWYGLPSEVLDDDNIKIDAVFERPDHKIVFFIGKHFYILAGNSYLEEGPLPLKQLGLPDTLEKVDGAMKWGWNGRTYFFSGSMYWRFDETAKHVELDYPRDISMWVGIPNDIDSVFQFFDGKTYFFKGQRFWEFDDRKMKIVDVEPTLENQSINVKWLKCPPREMIRDPFQSEESSLNQGLINVIMSFHIFFGNCIAISFLLLLSQYHLNTH